jgi:hypothetical protein
VTPRELSLRKVDESMRLIVALTLAVAAVATPAVGTS